MQEQDCKQLDFLPPNFEFKVYFSDQLFLKKKHHVFHSRRSCQRTAFWRILRSLFWFCCEKIINPNFNFSYFNRFSVIQVRWVYLCRFIRVTLKLVKKRLLRPIRLDQTQTRPIFNNFRSPILLEIVQNQHTLYSASALSQVLLK